MRYISCVIDHTIYAGYINKKRKKMKNLTGYETYLKSGRVNEQNVRPTTKNFILDVAAENGVDAMELLRMVEDDLAEVGMHESFLLKESIDSVITLSEFFIILPSVITGLVTLALGGSYIEGTAQNKRWIKAEADKRVREMIKKDPSLIDRQAELISQVAEEIKNDPEIKKMLRSKRMEGGAEHPDIKKDRSTYRSHIFGGGY
jgi:hypothetical protein